MSFLDRRFFGSDKTSIKILHLLRAKARADENNNCPHFPYSDSGGIAKKGELVSSLSIALREAINYDNYKKLNNDDKKKIKSLVSDLLYEHAKQYESTSYHKWKQCWGHVENVTSEKKSTGISFSTSTTEYTTALGDDPYDEVRIEDASFPESLFLDSQKLMLVIAAALAPNFKNLLTEKGLAILPGGMENFLKHANDHGSFRIDALNEIITGYLDDDVDFKQKTKK